MKIPFSIFLVFTLLFIACKNPSSDESDPTDSDPIYPELTSFVFSVTNNPYYITSDISGEINEETLIVLLKVPYETIITALTADFTASNTESFTLAGSSVTSGSNSINYEGSDINFVLTSSDGNTKTYIIRVFETVTRDQLDDMIDNDEDITRLDVSGITDMRYLFHSSSCNQDIGDWDVSNVTNMTGMFENNTVFNQDIGDWDVSNVETFLGMFCYVSSFNQNIGSWDVRNAESFSAMFNGATTFNQDIGDWDVGSSSNFNLMFKEATAFNQDIGDWDVSVSEQMDKMFHTATSFNQDISGWDVSNTFYMGHMFCYASSFNQDIGDWDVSDVETMTYMFYSATNFYQDLSGWNVSICDSYSNFADETSMPAEYLPDFQ